jgi:hypothetical protein
VNRPSPAGLVHSIQARLKNAAREAGRPFAELLELFAVERFLHRLGRSEHRERFVLKGALLLRHWLGVHTRPTRDIDLLGAADMNAERLHGLLRELLVVEVEDDGIEFQPDSITVRSIRVESPVLGLRAKFDARLGRARLRYQVDVGLGDAVFPPAEAVVPGGLLGFPMASVRAYTPYTTVAEKLEAIVELGEANSRLKDYYDLALLPRALAFDGPTLVESIRRTFARRAMVVPSEALEGLSGAFAQSALNIRRWRAFLEKGGLKAASPDLFETVEGIRRFAQPALDAVRDGRSLVEHWPPGGPWR